jgi:putative ABC transport system ATP-binding protein
MSQDIIIRTENVKKLYRLGDEEVWALKGISIDIRRGEFLSIMGPSGSGKSTFFNQIGALDVPTEGKVFFEGESLFDLPESKQAWVRCNRIGYIFQTFNLIPVMSALQNVALPMTFQGATREESTARAAAILERVGLGHRLHHKPFELSGGQQQRTFLARAFVQQADMWILDEPFQGVDAETEHALVAVLQALQTKGKTIIAVHHDLQTLPRYFDYLFAINVRRIAEGYIRDIALAEVLKQTFAHEGIAQ